MCGVFVGWLVVVCELVCDGFVVVGGWWYCVVGCVVGFVGLFVD